MTEVSLSATGIYAQPSMELGYDDAGRVTGIWHTAEAQTLADYSFPRDGAGQLVQKISTDGTLDSTYDVTGQLTGVSGWRTDSSGYALVGS